MSTSGESRGKESELVKKQYLEKGFQFNIAVISVLEILCSTPTLAGGFYKWLLYDLNYDIFC